MAEVADKYFNLGSSYRGRIVVDETSTNAPANTSVIRIRVYVRKDAGSGYQGSDSDARQWSVSGIGGSTGSSSASGESPYNYTGATPQEDKIADFTRTINHNDNGTWTDTISVSITHNNNPPGNGSTTVSFTLTNFPEPSTSGHASSLITATTARLSANASNGNGTSSTMEFQYRKTGDTTWISAGTGSPKNLSGLIPSTNYQWRVIITNNQGNTGTSSTQNFTTLPAAQAFGVFYGRKVLA